MPLNGISFCFYLKILLIKFDKFVLRFYTYKKWRFFMEENLVTPQTNTKKGFLIAGSILFGIGALISIYCLFASIPALADAFAGGENSTVGLAIYFICFFFYLHLPCTCLLLLSTIFFGLTFTSQSRGIARAGKVLFVFSLILLVVMTVIAIMIFSFVY